MKKYILALFVALFSFPLFAYPIFYNNTTNTLTIGFISSVDWTPMSASVPPGGSYISTRYSSTYALYPFINVSGANYWFKSGVWTLQNGATMGPASFSGISLVTDVNGVENILALNGTFTLNSFSLPPASSHLVGVNISYTCSTYESRQFFVYFCPSYSGLSVTMDNNGNVSAQNDTSIHYSVPTYSTNFYLASGHSRTIAWSIPITDQPGYAGGKLAVWVSGTQFNADNSEVVDGTVCFFQAAAPTTWNQDWVYNCGVQCPDTSYQQVYQNPSTNFVNTPNSGSGNISNFTANPILTGSGTNKLGGMNMSPNPYSTNAVGQGGPASEGTQQGLLAGQNTGNDLERQIRDNTDPNTSTKNLEKALDCPQTEVSKFANTAQQNAAGMGTNALNVANGHTGDLQSPSGQTGDIGMGNQGSSGNPAFNVTLPDPIGTVNLDPMSHPMIADMISSFQALCVWAFRVLWALWACFYFWKKASDTLEPVHNTSPFKTDLSILGTTIPASSFAVKLVIYGLLVLAFIVTQTTIFLLFSNNLSAISYAATPLTALAGHTAGGISAQDIWTWTCTIVPIVPLITFVTMILSSTFTVNGLCIVFRLVWAATNA